MLHHEKPLPRNTLAAVGLLLSVAALALGVAGAAFFPANLPLVAPGPAGRALAYYLPLLFGLGGVLLGGRGLHRIEEADGQLAGDWQGVFAVLMGGLAAVVGGVQVFAAHVWPAVG